MAHRLERQRRGVAVLTRQPAAWYFTGRVRRHLHLRGAAQLEISIVNKGEA